MSEGKKIEASVGNDYGLICVVMENGKYYIEIESDGVDGKAEVSKEFYEAWVKEFGDAKR